MAARTLPLSLEEFHALYDGAKPAYEYWQADRRPRLMNEQQEVRAQIGRPTGQLGLMHADRGAMSCVGRVFSKGCWNSANLQIAGVK